MSDILAPASHPDQLSRRVLLGGLAGAAAVGTTAFAGSPAGSANLLSSQAPVRDPFTLGVASGDPEPDGFVLWTRLAPEPIRGGGMPQRAVPVQWQVATDRRFRRVMAQGTEIARPGLAHSVHVEVEGLRPASEYFYRFRVGREISPIGRARTAPEYGSRLDDLSFAFASCQTYAGGYFSAHEHMAKEDLDLVVHLGDYIYEGPPRPYLIRLHEGDGEPMTLTDYRNRHAQYKTDPQLQRAHAACPWIVVFDDHELDNDWAAAIPQDPEIQTRKQFAARRAAALQAYYEHMPLRRSALPAGGSLQAYRSFTYGDLATFHVLDTRQYRSDQIAECSVAEREETGYCGGALVPGRSILGDDQERWLLDGLTISTTRWNVLANQVAFTQRDKDETPGAKQRTFNLDGWDGYVADRQTLLDHVREQKIRNMVTITGDSHRNSVLNTPANYRDWEADTTPVATEFMVTSTTSGGERRLNRHYRPEPDNNPHLLYGDESHGYARVRLTADEWRTDYRAVSTVAKPEATISTVSSWVVDPDEPGARRA